MSELESFAFNQKKEELVKQVNVNVFRFQINVLFLYKM